MQNSSKFIKIESQGIIEPKAFTLIGASTKRQDNSKIGFFGSGLKYSIAFLLRNKINFKVFAEYKEIFFGTETEVFRDQDFSVITVNSEPTSMTTEMGMDWEHWFVIREIYCNALDEGNSSINIVSSIDKCVPQEGKTIFYIEIVPEFQDIIDKWDSYFCGNRKDTFYSDGENTIFSGGENLIIYRKGIRCLFAPAKKCVFNYDMTWIEINESRVIKWEWDFNYKLRDYLQKMDDAKIIAQLLVNINNTWEADLNWSSGTTNYSDTWATTIGNKVLIPYENAGFWQEYYAQDPKAYLILPGTLIEGLKVRFAEEIKVIGDLGGDSTKGDFKQTEVLSKREMAILDECMEFLKSADYSIKYPVKVGEFASEKVLGQALNKTILISNKLFELGRKKMVAVLIEEQEHLETGYNDETRAFQDHLFNKIVTCLENQTGKYL